MQIKQVFSFRASIFLICVDVFSSGWMSGWTIQRESVIQPSLYMFKNPHFPRLKNGKLLLRRTIPFGDENRSVNVVSRTVQITQNWTITIWEWENPANVIESYWQNVTESYDVKMPVNDGHDSTSALLDPFGLVLWPGSIVAAKELFRKRKFVSQKRVLVLGAGVGVEAQAAAEIGASIVVATDIHPTVLQLLEYGSQQSHLDHIIQTKTFDIMSSTQTIDFSSFDVIVIADVLYNIELASHIARRIQEARSSINADTGIPPVILVSDSQRFVHNFEDDVNRRLQKLGEVDDVRWQNVSVPKFTGSGVLINDDQTYDVNARFMWIGIPSCD